MERDYILDEIRRCAAENGGTPPGRTRFRDATGIKVADWEGKYWARWSDALLEAGFAPNSFNKDATSDDLLLEKLALLTRKLGHFPVVQEISLARVDDSTIPHRNVFQRLGSRSARLARVVEWCSTRPDFADVYAVCAPLVVDAPNIDADGDDSSVSSQPKDGYVYLVKSGKHYKIGRSNHAGRRFYEIDLQLPEKLTVVHHVETDDPAGIERYWHQRFADKRANGEWFALTKADVQAFKRRRRFM